jgi:hypothetical protein
MLYNYKLFEKIMQQKLFSFITHTTEDLIGLLIDEYKINNKILYPDTNYYSISNAFKEEMNKFKIKYNFSIAMIDNLFNKIWLQLGEDTQKSFLLYCLSEENDLYNFIDDELKIDVLDKLELNDISEITEEYFYKNVENIINIFYEVNPDIEYNTEYLTDFSRKINFVELFREYAIKDKINIIQLLYNYDDSDDFHHHELEDFVFDNKDEEYITIHRKIFLPDNPDQLENQLKKFKGVGIFWSYKKEHADVYWEHDDFDKKYYITFEALVNINNINWENTIIKSFYSLSSEREIELYPNTSVILKAIYLNTKEEILSSKLINNINDYYKNNPMAIRNQKINIENTDIPEKCRLEFKNDLFIKV